MKPHFIPHGAAQTLIRVPLKAIFWMWMGACSMAQVHAAPESIPGASEPQRQIHLQAAGVVEVPADWLSFVLSTTVQGADPQSVQRQLKAAVDAALTEARKAESAGQLEVRTGSFSLNPNYGRDNRISSWQGSAELVLQGRDFDRISRVAGSVRSMTVARTEVSLSRELREQSETQALELAMAQFRSKSQQLAKGFGFTGYTLREVHVQAGPVMDGPAPVMMRMARAATVEDAPVPVEGGKTSVRVSLSGSIQLK